MCFCTSVFIHFSGILMKKDIVLIFDQMHPDIQYVMVSWTIHPPFLSTSLQVWRAMQTYSSCSSAGCWWKFARANGRRIAITNCRKTARPCGMSPTRSSRRTRPVSGVFCCVQCLPAILCWWFTACLKQQQKAASFSLWVPVSVKFVSPCRSQQ